MTLRGWMARAQGHSRDQARLRNLRNSLNNARRARVSEQVREQIRQAIEEAMNAGYGTEAIHQLRRNLFREAIYGGLIQNPQPCRLPGAGGIPGMPHSQDHLSRGLRQPPPPNSQLGRAR